MRSLALVLAALFAVPTCLPAAAPFLQRWRAVANRLIHTAPESYPFNWGEGIQMIGLMKIHERTGEERYANYVERWTDLYLRKDITELLHFGPAFEGKRTGYCGHWSPGTAILLLHESTQNPAHLKLARQVSDFIRDHAERSPEGGLGHWQGSHQYWVDTLYMACPLLAGLGQHDERKDYLDDAANQIIVFAKHLQDKKTGLFFHMWDWETREISPGLWARGNGWVLMSLADTIETLDKKHKSYGKLKSIAGKMAKGLKKTQSPTGLWHTVLDDPDSYEETSATMMFTYGLLKLVRLKALSDDYQPIAGRAWAQTNDRYVRNGLLTGVSAGTEPRGVEHYGARDRGTYTWGTGAYLMAGSEVDRLGPRPKGKATPRVKKPRDPRVRPRPLPRRPLR